MYFNEYLVKIILYLTFKRKH